ncbi:MAG: hypothetical protein GWP05_04320 [Anaerolineaceae bacterium]|nr:hypothetical protein [Anaerolineaceae bacterium]
MRSVSVALAVILLAGALAVAAIETEEVSLDSIKGQMWDLDFTFRTPRRIVLTDKDGQAQAYWYLLYTVTNKTKKARNFVPQAIIFTNNGKVARDILQSEVQKLVKAQYRLGELKNSVEMMGPSDTKDASGKPTAVKPSLKAGQEEAQDGIFIFREVDPEMDKFTVFVAGLSGKFVVREIPAAKEGGKPHEVVLRKTLRLDFSIPGDDVKISEDKVYLLKQKWIWR